MICNKNSQGGKTTWTTFPNDWVGRCRSTPRHLPMRPKQRCARRLGGREFQLDKNKPRVFFTGMSLYSIAGLSIKIWESLLACHDIFFFVMFSPLQVWISFKFIGYWRLNMDEKHCRCGAPWASKGAALAQCFDLWRSRLWPGTELSSLKKTVGFRWFSHGTNDGFGGEKMVSQKNAGIRGSTGLLPRLKPKPN